MAAATLLPTLVEAGGFADLDALRAWAVIEDDLWAAVVAVAGPLTLRSLASLTGADIAHLGTIAVVNAGMGTERALNLAERAALGLGFRAARVKYQLPDIIPADPRQAAAALQPASPMPADRSRQVTVATVLDPADAGVVVPLDAAEVDDHFAAVAARRGGPIREAAEPTADQIGAMKARVLVHKEVPYADFSILTPYGRRLQKHLKTKSWSMNPDGKWYAIEVPGPSTYSEWLCCWRVYENLLLGLREGVPPVALFSIASLEAYAENVRVLATEFPDLWGLVCRAEDRCRSEHLVRVRRRMQIAHDAGMCPTFQPNAPWDSVFRGAAEDESFWNKEVRHPALHVLAQHSRIGEKAEAAAADIADGRAGAGRFASVRQPGEKSRGEHPAWASAKRSRQDGDDDAPPPPHGPRTRSQPDKQGEHPKKFGKLFGTTREGTPICFKYQRDKCSSDVCPAQRAHVCQGCLGPHPYRKCSEAKKSGGKGAGKR
jgi:hypothetical protein